MEDCGCNKSGGCEGGVGNYLQIVIIVLLLVLIWMIMSYNEMYVGYGLAGMGPYTSGATLRRLGQKFSSTDQGETTTQYNADLGQPDVATHVVGNNAFTSTI